MSCARSSGGADPSRTSGAELHNPLAVAPRSPALPRVLGLGQHHADQLFAAQGIQLGSDHAGLSCQSLSIPCNPVSRYDLLMVAASGCIVTRLANCALALMRCRSRFTHGRPAFQVDWPQYTIAREVILLRTLSGSRSLRARLSEAQDDWRRARDAGG